MGGEGYEGQKRREEGEEVEMEEQEERTEFPPLFTPPKPSCLYCLKSYVPL